MKKTGILGILALLLITAAFAACVQAPDNSSTVIKYKIYGGFVMQTYAIQELIVTQDKATFTISAADGNITKQFEKALTKDQFNAIVKVFTDNNFDSFGDRYDEGQNHVTDVGFSDITFTANGKTKTVTAYNFNDYLPAGLAKIREKLQETVAFTQTLDESQLQKLAGDWIQGAPTYAYDGSGLTFVSAAQLESFPVQHVLTYNFTSSHAGYGNRSAAMTAQVITGHTIRVTIVDGNIQSAVIDGKWDEMGQFVPGSDIALAYRPKQCEKTPWQSWEANSGRVYIRAPTEEEILKSYYTTVYSTGVKDFKTIQLAEVSCQACDVCLATYRFELTVNASEMQPLLDEGWTRIG
jgi:opacity protein-like surface antigen